MGAANALRQNKTDKIDARELAALGRKHGTDLQTYRYRSWGPKQKVARKLQAYFGFDPKLCESGQCKGWVRVPKRSVELARTALFQAATCAFLHDPDIKTVFVRRKAQGKFYLVCISHIMRVLLRRLVAVLSTVSASSAIHLR